MFKTDAIWDYLKEFRWAHFRLTYRAEEKIIFPEYKGSTFRGPFGHTFRRLVCTHSEFPSCLECPAKYDCPYAIVFETTSPKNSPIMKEFQDVPRPFVIEPELDSKREYFLGEKFNFDLLIFGKALELFPFFILTFRELTSQGIGKNRGKATLEKIEQFFGEKTQVIFLEEDGTFPSKLETETGMALKRKEGHFLKNNSPNLDINFLTMTRLVYKGRFAEIPHFHILLRNLARRVSALATLYNGLKMDLDFQTLFSLAEKVHISKNLATWFDWPRYSQRQQNYMLMGGLLGSVEYNFEEVGMDVFLPFLLVGEVTHVGKGTVFGLGKYLLLNSAKMLPGGERNPREALP